MTIKFNDISDALCKLLKTNFPTYSIYTEEVIQKLKRPSFHISVMPIGSTMDNVFYNQENLLIDIAYFSDEKPDLQSVNANNEMSNKLKEVLNLGFQVKDRFLKIGQLNFETVDRVLHTNFTLLWYNINRVTLEYLEQFDIMQKFDISDGRQVVVLLDDSIYISTSDGEYVKSNESEIEFYR